MAQWLSAPWFNSPVQKKKKRKRKEKKRKKEKKLVLNEVIADNSQLLLNAYHMSDTSKSFTYIIH